LTDLDKKFQEATEAVKQLAARPDNETLLELYGLYKQGSEGDVTGKRPGMMNLIARAKYDAWSKLTGTAPDKAQQDYVDLVNRCLAADSK